MTKEEIRNIIKQKKSLITLNEKNEAASKLFTTLEECAAFKNCNNILLYHSLPDEIMTHHFIDKWCNKKNIFLPKVTGNNLEILPFCSDLLQIGAFNIQEPTNSNPVDIDTIDLIIVPAVAIDRNGNRLGRGKGYYDRLLCNTKTTKIGIIDDFQFIDDIPSDPHDVRMDIIITPTRLIKLNTQ